MWKLFISKHQMHELIICGSLPPQLTSLKSFKNSLLYYFFKALYCILQVIYKVEFKYNMNRMWHWLDNKIWFVDIISLLE